MNYENQLESAYTWNQPVLNNGG